MPQSIILLPLRQSQDGEDKKNREIALTNESPRWSIISVAGKCHEMQPPGNTYPKSWKKLRMMTLNFFLHDKNLKVPIEGVETWIY